MWVDAMSCSLRVTCVVGSFASRLLALRYLQVSKDVLSIAVGRRGTDHGPTTLMFCCYAFHLAL